MTFAERKPVAEGLKITLILQLLFGRIVDGQLFVWEKSPWFAPPTAIEDSVSVPFPVLVNVEN